MQSNPKPGVTISGPHPHATDIDAADLRPLTACAATLMAALERYESRREYAFSGVALWTTFTSAAHAAIQAEEELRRLAPNPTDMLPLIMGTPHRVSAIWGLYEALKFTRDRGVWQWNLGEAPNLAKLLAECRWFVEDSKSEQPAKGRTGRRKSSEKDSAAEVIAAINKHHGYDDASVTNLKPATNRGLHKEYGISSAALSRFLKDRFPDEKKTHFKYQAACRDPARLVP